MLMKTHVVAALVLSGAFTVTLVNAAEPAYVNTYHPLKAATAWNDVSHWYNDTTKAAATAIPGADDCVNLNQNGRNVNADGCTVAYSRMNVASGSNVAAAYSQTGGSLTSGYWTFLGYNGGAGSMHLTNVNAVLNGYRLSVGQQSSGSAAPADCLFQMRGGSLVTDFSDGLLTSTWGRNHGTSTIDLDGTDWHNKNKAVKIGFGSVNTNRVHFRNGTFVNESEFQLGANVQNWGDQGCGYDEAVFENCVWTNKGQILCSASQHRMHLVLSNAVFAAVNNDNSIKVGAQAGGDDELEIVSCPQFYCKTAPVIGGGANSHARIAIRGQKGAGCPSALTLLSGFNFSGQAGRSFDVDVADSDYVPGGTFNSLKNDGQSARWTFRDGAYDWGSRAVTVVPDKTGTGELVFSNAIVRTSGNVTLAYGNAATNAVLRLVDSNAGFGGNLYVANETSDKTACGHLIVDGGELSALNLHGPRQGRNSEIIITNGAKVVADSVFAPNMTGSSGRLFLAGDFTVTNKINACNQSGTTGVCEQVSGTFDVSAAGTRSFAGPTDCSYRYIQRGGSFTSGSAKLLNFAAGSRSTGRLELLGGEFAVKGFSVLTGDSDMQILFDGGVLKALVDLPSNVPFIPSGFGIKVGDGGAVIDLGGFGGLQINSAIVHDLNASAIDGGLRIKGNGSIAFAGTPTFTGDLVVESGTATFLENVAVAENAALSGGGEIVMGAGKTLTVNGAVCPCADQVSGLAVDGPVVFGANAKVAVPTGMTLDESKKYTLLTATSITGEPQLDGTVPNGWAVLVQNGRIVLKKSRGAILIFK